MAKEKKKQELTLEEKLEQALVPESEWSYEVPENWVWVRLADINKYQSSLINPAKMPDQLYELYSVPIYESGMPEIVEGRKIGSTKQAVKKGDVLLCKINPRINRVWAVARYTSYALIASSEWVVIRPDSIDSKFLQFVFTTQYFRKLLLSNVSGVGGSLMRAQPKYIHTYPVPIPPLVEQQRIVEKIESLFIKLDHAKDLVQSVLDSFETRKAAILQKAFTGELTAQWRKENNVELDSWKEKRFDEVAIIRSNLVDPKEFSSFPHIAPDNIEKKTGVLLPYRTVEEDGVKSGKHRFYAGQILYSKIRPYLSKVVIIDFDGLCSADMYPIEAMEEARYLWYYMLSEDFLKQASSAGSRSVLPKINQKELSLLYVTIPGLPEQQEVVRILDILCNREQEAKEKITPVLDEIDVMKKSILAKAFRGELGTNDPTEESAIELLKEVLAKQ